MPFIESILPGYNMSSLKIFYDCGYGFFFCFDFGLCYCLNFGLCCDSDAGVVGVFAPACSPFHLFPLQMDVRAFEALPA